MSNEITADSPICQICGGYGQLPVPGGGARECYACNGKGRVPASLAAPEFASASSPIPTKSVAKMDPKLLLDAVCALERLHRPQAPHNQDLWLFNALLGEAKALYPHRPDILALRGYDPSTYCSLDDFMGSVERLRVALELRPPASVAQLLAEIRLPPDAPDLGREMQELEGAISLGLCNTALLLVGSIAEALLLSRHPDQSERGPGLGDLVKEARIRRLPLFGEDTLRALETLTNYRDIIHPRAERRAQIVPNETRVESALVALKLLCSELQNPDRRY